MRFDGTQHIILIGGSRVTEAEDLSFRFRTLEKDTLFVATRDASSPDRLQITLGRLWKNFCCILKHSTRKIVSLIYSCFNLNFLTFQRMEESKHLFTWVTQIKKFILGAI